MWPSPSGAWPTVPAAIQPALPPATRPVAEVENIQAEVPVQNRVSATQADRFNDAYRYSARRGGWHDGQHTESGYFGYLAFGLDGTRTMFERGQYHLVRTRCGWGRVTAASYSTDPLVTADNVALRMEVTLRG